MSAPTRSSLQTYQTVLYSRALHPELFALKARKVIKHGDYEFEAWLMPGSHVLRFEYRKLCASELVTDHEDNLPAAAVVTAFLCAGERDFEHPFTEEKAVYMTSVQTETLSENLYTSTYKETLQAAADADSIIHQWRDDAGPCLSVLEFQRYNREVHTQAYHLVAHGGVVLRTQSLFEVRG